MMVVLRMVISRLVDTLRVRSCGGGFELGKEVSWLRPPMRVQERTTNSRARPRSSTSPLGWIFRPVRVH